MGAGSNVYRIGIVGCGNIAGTHAETVISTRYGELVAAHSRTQSNLDRFCDKYHTNGFTDFEEFLSNDDMDTVVICTPSGTHLDYGKAAADAGKNVIVEKPIEVSLKRGRSLIESCRLNGVKLAVIYQNRFIDGVRKMKEIIDAGELGNIFMVDTSVKWYRDQEYYDSAAWRGTLSLDGGGAVINQAIHTVDLMLWFCGELESLHAYKGTFTHERIEGEDNAVASLKFRNGAIGVFRASTSVVPPKNRTVEVHGTNGTAVLDGDVFKMMTSEQDMESDEGKSQSAGSSAPMAGMTANHHKKQYDQILDAFFTDREPVVSGEKSLNSLAVVEALYLSAESQKPVQMEELLSAEDQI